MNIYNHYKKQLTLHIPTTICRKDNYIKENLTSIWDPNIESLPHSPDPPLDPVPAQPEFTQPDIIFNSPITQLQPEPPQAQISLHACITFHYALALIINLFSVTFFFI